LRERNYSILEEMGLSKNRLSSELARIVVVPSMAVKFREEDDRV
jgi:hypothetical protein